MVELFPPLIRRMCFSDFATGPEPDAVWDGRDEELALTRREGAELVLVFMPILPLAEADR